MFSRFMIAAATAACIVVAGPAAAADRACRVTAVEGDNAAYRNGEFWKEISVGLLAPEATVLRTGPATRMEITCDDGIVVTVGPGTQIDLGELQGPTGEDTSILIQLLGGIVGIVAPERTWGVFEVITPLAIASVRSTEWLVEYEPGAPAAVFVREGRVSVRVGGALVETASLGEGEGITVTPAETMLADQTPAEEPKVAAGEAEAGTGSASGGATGGETGGLAIGETVGETAGELPAAAAPQAEALPVPSEPDAPDTGLARSAGDAGAIVAMAPPPQDAIAGPVKAWGAERIAAAGSRLGFGWD